MNSPVLIASYPRSGSTWLRFIFCHLLHRGIEHDMSSVNCFSPSIDSWTDMVHASPMAKVYKTHRHHEGLRIVHLVRHVGDVLISEYWYKRKFHNDPRELEEVLIADDFGQGWRQTVDYYSSCPLCMRYEDIGDAVILFHVLKLLGMEVTNVDVTEVLKKTDFKVLQVVEEKGFGLYPAGDTSIKFFRDGTSSQWTQLPAWMQAKILEKNFEQLQKYGYL